MSFPKYRYLITYRLAEILFDLVDQFVLNYLSNLGNLSYLSLKDQILKTARSIKQNIIEAVSEVASLKSQIKLLGVSYGSVEELIADLEDFLRRKNLEVYPKNHPKTAAFRRLGKNLSHLSNLNHIGYLKKKPLLPNSSQDAANLILTLAHQLSYLLSRQIKAAEEKFLTKGGYTENLYQKRLNRRKLLKLPKKPKLLIAFTLMEILIIIGLVALLATAALVLLNPKNQIAKAWDAKRKNDLNTLGKVFEDYYNDHGCYPTPDKVCYNSPNIVSGTYICNICGTEPTSPSFSPYLSKLPCDPQHPTYKYLYQVDSLSCPKWFRVYSVLSSVWSRETDDIGCGEGGCGPPPAYGYDYGVSSPNISFQKTPFFYCYLNTNSCGICSGSGGDYYYCYSNPSCVKIYPTKNDCCANHRGAWSCR